jgi:FtsP/CotA-like multicopper oxidase with cupredoxin domain
MRAVTLINELEDSTTLHFHGMRQARPCACATCPAFKHCLTAPRRAAQHATPWFDGVPGVTQCPIGNTTGSNAMTFTFVAEPAGTYYYHAHFRQQARHAGSAKPVEAILLTCVRIPLPPRS